MKAVYRLMTSIGDVFNLTENGAVILEDSKNLDDWVIMGIRELKPFGRFGELIPLDEAVEIKSYAFKNGYPKYVIQDYDHGEVRIWLNPKYHGVRSLYKI